MKKFISFLCAIAITFSIGTIGSFAAEPSNTESYHYDYLPDGVEKPTSEEVNVLNGFALNNDDFLSYDLVTAATVRKVAVTEPCDQTWRAKYPDSWMWEANRVVTAADDLLTSRYGIQFYSVSQKVWNSNETNDPAALLTEARNEWGLSNNAKLMIAFTDRELISGVVAVNAGIGTPYMLLTCYGYEYNTFYTRHEVGHAYNLTDCNSSCFMNGTYNISNKDKICSTHDSQLNSNKTRY